MTKRAKLFVLLGMLTFALFNYPFLKIFNRNLCLIEDIPVLIYYLFWGLAAGHRHSPGGQKIFIVIKKVI
jgi:hypothetical protein